MMKKQTQSTENQSTKSVKKSKRKKQKVKYLPDDGRTLYSMDGLYDTGKESDKKSVHLEKGEKWQLIKAAFAVYGPIFLGVVACFTIGAVLIYFWLR